MKHVRNYLNSLALSALMTAVFSAAVGAAGTGGISGVRDAVNCLCYSLMQLIPIISMLMIIGAGVVYAAGQIMGAETRARASTWGTAMLIGAVIGILIVTVAPTVLAAMYPPATSGGDTIGLALCQTPPAAGTC